MKIIKLFEDFDPSTIQSNNNIYNKYLKKKGRSNKVAWDFNSQEKNFNLVSQHINTGDSLLDYGCGIGDFIKHLGENNIEISNYLGVDINPKYIELAKESYPDRDFKLINSLGDIGGNYDVSCAIGVFTWYIKKEEFIKTVQKLVNVSKKCVLMTFLFGNNPYSEGLKESDSFYKVYWESNYRYYSQELFTTLFPDLDFEFQLFEDMSGGSDTLLVKINK
jgi:cyclopropane fatty-acyl-phospholipid synthase-like methyltransferase